MASKIPADLKYSESHEWVRLEANVATIGITDFAQHALTDVVFVELPKKGAKLQFGKPFGVVESVKSVSELFAPLSGEVTAVNEALSKNDDPYGEGWLIRVQMSSPAEGKNLLDAAKYRSVIGE
jgi:glycine cleavage system H protein